MKSNKVGQCVLLLSLAYGIVLTPALAIDGYKSLKFGAHKKEVMESKLCTLDEANSGQVGVKFLSCDDFKFGSKIVEAGAFFINNEFLRFGIMPSIDMAVGLSKGLSKKYGEPSSASTTKEFEDVDHFPNKEAFLAFDDNTIILKVMSDENNIQTALLIYTSLKYDRLLLKQQQNSMADDL